jgi:hypothetical protein
MRKLKWIIGIAIALGIMAFITVCVVKRMEYCYYNVITSKFCFYNNDCDTMYAIVMPDLKRTDTMYCIPPHGSFEIKAKHDINEGTFIRIVYKDTNSSRQCTVRWYTNSTARRNPNRDEFTLHSEKTYTPSDGNRMPGRNMRVVDRIYKWKMIYSNCSVYESYIKYTDIEGVCHNGRNEPLF